MLTTVAGPGSSLGDGGPATNASVYQPFGLALDGSGYLFIADQGHGRVRRVDTIGIITTVAGNGGSGFSGDGGPATNASFRSVTGLAVDTVGNLFIGDENNGRVRMVDTNGIITTFAGGGRAAPGDGGPATNASLGLLQGIAADSFGNVFFADASKCRVRKVTNTQGPGLGLNDATVANAGNYQVIVTGPSGSVTSSVAILTVATAPMAYATVANPDGSVTFSFVSPPNSTNMLFCATDLVAPVTWQPLSTNLAGADGDWQFTDTSAAGTPAR